MIMKTTGSEMCYDLVGFQEDQDGLSRRADE